MTDEDASQAAAPPEMPPAPAEPEATQSQAIEPRPAETQTAQISVNEAIVIESEPLPEPQPSTPVSVVTHTARDLWEKARAAIQNRKRRKLDKIMEVLNTKSKVTNDEVEKLLHVSDATATRYLSMLEKEGKIQQVGKTGAGVTYTKLASSQN